MGGIAMAGVRGNRSVFEAASEDEEAWAAAVASLMAIASEELSYASRGCGVGVGRVW